MSRAGCRMCSIPDSLYPPHKRNSKPR
jgi:hypothetical protein